MKNLEDIYHRLEANKKKRKEINKMLKDELTHHQNYQEVVDEIAGLKEQKKSIEQDVRAGVPESRELEELKIDIATDQEILADVALDMYAKNQTVEITDEFDQIWYPVFKVSFKKSN
ncbi:MAG TPA: hypothetical protein QGH92_02990 [Candidatus Parcubacteria bacterium]|nr:hypothetical protein [Candidatus Parcubacteria bacterium]|tara:strand:+ start:260 stop:610 length:351 start_codon:yes stop_codon:yes gene_type:complete